MPIVHSRNQEDITPFYESIYKLFAKGEILGHWHRYIPFNMQTVISKGECVIVEGITEDEALVLSALYMREINDFVETTWYDKKSKKLYLLHHALSTKWRNILKGDIKNKINNLVQKILLMKVYNNIVDDFQGYPLFDEYTDFGRSGAS